MTQLYDKNGYLTKTSRARNSGYAYIHGGLELVALSRRGGGAALGRTC